MNDLGQLDRFFKKYNSWK